MACKCAICNFTRDGLTDEQILARQGNTPAAVRDLSNHRAWLAERKAERVAQKATAPVVAPQAATPVRSMPAALFVGGKAKPLPMIRGCNACRVLGYRCAHCTHDTY